MVAVTMAIVIPNPHEIATVIDIRFSLFLSESTIYGELVYDGVVYDRGRTIQTRHWVWKKNLGSSFPQRESRFRMDLRMDRVGDVF